MCADCKPYLAARNQANKYLPGIQLFKIIAACASPPFLLGAQLRLQAKEKSTKRKEKGRS